jgi:hypothetical protein
MKVLRLWRPIHEAVLNMKCTGHDGLQARAICIADLNIAANDLGL